MGKRTNKHQLKGQGLYKDQQGQPGVCRVCGCTDETPCLSEGWPCAWANKEHTLCTACASGRKTK